MKSLQSLSKRVDQWWRMYITNAPQQRQPGYNPCRSSPGGLPGAISLQIVGEQKSAPKFPPTAFFVLAVTSIASSFGYELYSTPQLRPGTIAPETIVAPRTETVIDEKATEEKRKSIRSGSYTVLKIDLELNQELNQILQSLLAQGNELRRLAGEFPYVDSALLPVVTQDFLRQLPEVSWQEVVNGVHSPVFPPPVETVVMEPELQGVIAQLRSLKQNNSVSEWGNFWLEILSARDRYQQALDTLLAKQTEMGALLYDRGIWHWEESIWQETQAGIGRAQERLLTQGLAEGLPQSQLEAAIALQVADLVPPETQAFAQQTLNLVLKGQHNLVYDKEAASRLAQKAADAFPNIEYPIHQGEIIVNEGEVISAKQFVLIDHFELSQRQINWEGLTGYAFLIAGAVSVFLVCEQRFHPGMRQRDHILILLLTLTAPLMVSFEITSIALSAIGLLLGGFYGSTIATTVVGLIAGILPLGIEVTWNQWLASVSGGLLAGGMAGRMRSREEAALLGMGIGVTQAAVYLVVTLIQTAIAGITWQPLLTRAALQGLGGLASSIAALGLSPYLEHLFDLVTPVRLAEISNPNRPLLQRLASEAPGTFQHTLFVSTLAEAATRTLGGNCELVRAGTLYHDIGKMHDPLGFIENQMGGPNKHDEIKDPWKSAEIIKKHVTEGLVLAKQYRLPKAVQAFIPEHQGSMLIAFFYYQAKQMAQADPTLQVHEADFRYPGPIPQSRETGIVMLADSCEAALRSLKEATYEEALGMVNKILKARWQDHQLVESGLTLEDMPVIADTFVRVWQQFNHKRIAYPKGALPK